MKDDILEVLKNLEDFYSLNGASREAVEMAESELGLLFDDDFKKYLLTYGLVSADGHEFTGIVNSKRLNVVDVTLKLRSKFPNLFTNAYVIEELNIDDIVIWQTSDGSIYESRPGLEFDKIANSFGDYIKLKDSDNN